MERRGKGSVVGEAEEGKGKGSVEAVVVDPELGVGDGDAPAPADRGRADEVLRLVRREADEDLVEYLGRQRRRHGACAVARVWEVGIGSEVLDIYCYCTSLVTKQNI